MANNLRNSRFSKSQLVKDLQARADDIATRCGFSRNNGTAQLRISDHQNRAKKVKYDDIDQTVWYGKWKELLTLIDWIESGEFGRGRESS